MSKAFDCVDHGILLEKLGRMGVGSLDWFTEVLLVRVEATCGSGWGCFRI